MIEDLFKPQSKRIIEVLLKGSKSLTELSVILELSKPTLQQKHLKRLEEIGVIEKKIEKNERGREAIYSLNRLSIFYSINPDSQRCLSIITTSRFDLSFLLLEQIHADDFKEDVRFFIKRIYEMTQKYRPDVVILFGSVARGEGTWKSDIDIALLKEKWNDKLKRKILSTIAEITIDTNHQIKPQFITLSTFDTEDTVLLKEIKESGIIIYGDIFGRKDIWLKMKRYKSIMF